MSMLQTTRSQDSVRRVTEYDDESLSRQLRVRISDKQFEMLQDVAVENRLKPADVVRIIFTDWCASRLVEQ